MTHGSHTWQVGGTFKDILAHDTTVADYNMTEIGLGGQIFSLCGHRGQLAALATPACAPPISILPTPLLGPAVRIPARPHRQVIKRLQLRCPGQGAAAAYRRPALLPVLSDSSSMPGFLEDDCPASPLPMASPINGSQCPMRRAALRAPSLYLRPILRGRVAAEQPWPNGTQAVPLIPYHLGGKGNGSSAPPLYKPAVQELRPACGLCLEPRLRQEDGDQRKRRHRLRPHRHQRNSEPAGRSIPTSSSRPKPTHFGVAARSVRFHQERSAARLSNNSIAGVTLTPPATPKPPYQPFVTPGVPWALQNGRPSTDHRPDLCRRPTTSSSTAASSARCRGT